ncbi:hypothetical protein D3C75_784420 [compost metagenome]
MKRKIQQPFTGRQRKRLTIGKKMDMRVDETGHHIFPRTIDRLEMGGDSYSACFPDLLNQAVFINQNRHMGISPFFRISINNITVHKRITCLHRNFPRFLITPPKNEYLIHYWIKKIGTLVDA